MPDLPLDTLLILLLVLASLVGRLFQRKGKEEEAPPAPHTESERWTEEDDHEPEERYGYEEEAPEEERSKRKAFDLGEVLRDLQEQVTAATQPAAPPPPRASEAAPPPPPRRQPAAQSGPNQAARKRLRESLQREETAYHQTPADSRTSSATRLTSAVVRDLREPQSLRKAIVLREILGPPVSMRNPSPSDQL